MYKTFEMELAGRTLRVDVGRVAKQANGAVLMHYGDTTVLCTATASEKPRDGIDFFPLSVEYNERMYAVGKIPGGFNKREGKASENAILTCRVIDRPMRPLFPKDYRNDVPLESLVSSVLPARENQPFFDVQRGLRLRMQGKSIIPEPLDWCFRILICFRIIR